MSCLEGTRGFTITQLITSILLLVLIIVITIVGFNIFVAKACRITMKHDLENFVKAQKIFMVDNKRYLGEKGDFIAYGKPPDGKLVVPDFLFSPSEEVTVVIISGSGKNYHGPPAFKAIAKHNRCVYTYEYDFSKDIMTERKN